MLNRAFLIVIHTYDKRQININIGKIWIFKKWCLPDEYRKWDAFPSLLYRRSSYKLMINLTCDGRLFIWIQLQYSLQRIFHIRFRSIWQFDRCSDDSTTEKKRNHLKTNNIISKTAAYVRHIGIIMKVYLPFWGFRCFVIHIWPQCAQKHGGCSMLLLNCKYVLYVIRLKIYLLRILFLGARICWCSRLFGSKLVGASHVKTHSINSLEHYLNMFWVATRTILNRHNFWKIQT